MQMGNGSCGNDFEESKGVPGRCPASCECAGS